MSEREGMIQEFLAGAEWGDARREFLAGDASARSYERLVKTPSQETSVLMDAPPDKGEDIEPFLNIADYLTELGLSAPQIIASDTNAGLILLEDLGDSLFARVCAADPGLERDLYQSAVDLLGFLHKKTPPDDVPPYSMEVYTREAQLLCDWYIPSALGRSFEPEKQAQFTGLLTAAMTPLETPPPVTVLRDYHAENLLWLPDRDGIARTGLLDFQDALAGHPAYDLVSLLKDARRDTSPQLQAEMTERYIALTGQDRDSFLSAYAALGAQRNLKISGIFARLCIRDLKPGYVDLIPRVWNHLLDDLKHPHLKELQEFVLSNVPAPTPKVLDAIRQKSQHPTSVMVFAAGFGTRMGHLTKDLPKPMIPVNGTPLIDHTLDLIAAAGIRDVTVNTHYHGDVLTNHLEGRNEVRLSPEQPKPLETGGGLKLALPLLGHGPVFTLNPDAIWTGPNPLNRLIEMWNPGTMDALLLLVPQDKATGHKGGDFSMDSDGVLTRDGDERSWVYTGAQIVKTDGLAKIEQSVFSLWELWRPMMDQGRLYGCVHTGGWVDVGRPEGIILAESMLANQDV